ncbi:unnamed protein product [Dracunculus medinensis]|uniref:Olfactomedin-like domain-containing protein n=1 Tax=Dracunculus medinensis TaxID=318479 RepID=A0A0N4U469_DRAME|nr:unnamed protein product [Dracunculus medinensis]
MTINYLANLTILLIFLLATILRAQPILIKDIPESSASWEQDEQLPFEDYEEIVQPMKIPKLRREEKIAKILKTGQDRARELRRRVRYLNKEPVWRRVVPLPTKPLRGPLLALPITECPKRFDAVTRAHNGRTYLFSRDRVYQVWRKDNLHQRSSYHINDLFVDGPRTVTVAYTNLRSGVTILIEHSTVYRFRWNRKAKRFMIARKSPQPLHESAQLQPRVGFQWIDGNQILMESDKFITYDAYWNFPTFSGIASNYFPNLPRDIIGMAYQDGSSFLIYTASNKIMKSGDYDF